MKRKQKTLYCIKKEERLAYKDFLRRHNENHDPFKHSRESGLKAMRKRRGDDKPTGPDKKVI